VLRALSNANAIASQIGQGLAGVDYSAGSPTALDAAELLRRIAEGRPGLRLKLLPDLERTEAYSEGPTPPATQRRLVNWLVHDLRAQLALAKGDA
jgi:hypothetical protein